MSPWYLFAQMQGTQRAQLALDVDARFVLELLAQRHAG